LIPLQVGPSTDFLGSVFWQFTTFIVGIVAVIGFLVYRYYLEPPISRQMMGAKWKKGSPAFVQDDAGTVHFTINDIELPEGVVHNKRGWFLRSRSPYIPGAIVDVKGKTAFELAEEETKRGPGRPPKAPLTAKEDPMLETQVISTILEAPILAGLGKAVFFGYDGAPLLSNLKTLALTGTEQMIGFSKEDKGRSLLENIRIAAHADLRLMKEIIPATISRTQLGTLHRWSINKGYEKRGGDQMKLIYIAIAAAIVLGSLGIVAYMIMNGGKAAA
jgi:hypothetical protein